MSLNNKIKQQGFTIVELLIVIVVIGILAAIVIVAYNGVTARANSTKAQTNAVSVQKVAEAMNADNGSYPALAGSGTNSIATGSASAKAPSGVTVVPSSATPASVITSSNGLTTVAYACLTSCTNSTGGYVAYWNFTTSAVNYVYVGSGSGTLTTPTGTYVYPAT